MVNFLFPLISLIFDYLLIFSLNWVWDCTLLRIHHHVLIFQQIEEFIMASLRLRFLLFIISLTIEIIELMLFVLLFCLHFLQLS